MKHDARRPATWRRSCRSSYNGISRPASAARLQRSGPRPDSAQPSPALPSPRLHTQRSRSPSAGGSCSRAVSGDSSTAASRPAGLPRAPSDAPPPTRHEPCASAGFGSSGYALRVVARLLGRVRAGSTARICDASAGHPGGAAQVPSVQSSWATVGSRRVESRDPRHLRSPDEAADRSSLSFNRSSMIRRTRSPKRSHSPHVTTTSPRDMALVSSRARRDR